MTSKITVEHGYKDPALARLTKPGGDGRVVLDTYQGMIELRQAGYDAFELTGDEGTVLYYRTVTNPPRSVWIHGGLCQRIYGPNTVLALVGMADKNPDAKLAPTVTTERNTFMGQTCPACGNPTLTVDGEWGLGVKLANGYTPAAGELVKNHYMECSSETCGFEQAS